VAFAGHCDVIGFDINAVRIAELRQGCDHTREVEPHALRNAKVRYTDDPGELARVGAFIITVPTPIDSHRNPDLRPYAANVFLLLMRFFTSSAAGFSG
jgi:UDP-N-acetyl-D-galactosamine dehydrogenase